MSLLTGDWWLVIGGWKLLAVDCQLVGPRLLLAHGKPEAGSGLREGVARTTGEPQDVSRGVPGWLWDDRSFCYCPLASFELTFSIVFEPLCDMGIHFPMLLGLWALSPYACAAKSSKGE